MSIIISPAPRPHGQVLPRYSGRNDRVRPYPQILLSPSRASAFDYPGQQKKLLEQDGIRVDSTEDGDRVDLKQYGWKPSMDEAEELYALFRKLGI